MENLSTVCLGEYWLTNRYCKRHDFVGYGEGEVDWEWYLLSNRKKKQIAIKAGISPDHAHDLVYKQQNNWQNVLYDNNQKHYYHGLKIERYMKSNDMLFKVGFCRNCGDKQTVRQMDKQKIILGIEHYISILKDDSIRKKSTNINLLANIFISLREMIEGR